MKGISVIICCYNSAKRLPETFNYLLKQKIDDKFHWEIIIVDNLSTDNTYEVAKRFKLNHPYIRIEIVRAEIPGLIAARQKGIETTNYDYILFCDDDNWLDKDYLVTGYKILEHNSKVGAVGGTGRAYFENNEKPYWFDDFEALFAVGKQGDKSGYVTYTKGYVYGAGMFVRKAALNNISLENSVLTGRLGGKLSSGDDVELCYNIIINGYEIWWDSYLKFQHYISSNRATL